MANRLQELDQYITGLRTAGRPRRGAKSARRPEPPPKPDGTRDDVAAPAAQSRSRGLGRGRPGVARGMAAVDYRVPGVVPPIQQPNPMACWATAATMMVSWRDNVSLPIDEALRRIHPRYAEMFARGEGLPFAETAEFMATAGLQPAPFASFSIDGWEQMLRDFGPIFVFTDAGGLTATRIIMHAVVVAGVHGDGTPDGTSFAVVDPLDGKEHRQTVAVFIERFQRLPRRPDVPLQILIVHWPRDVQLSTQRSAAGYHPGNQPGHGPGAGRPAFGLAAGLGGDNLRQRRVFSRAAGGVTHGVFGGVITDPFYRSADEKRQLTGRSGGRARHLGIDVSLSNATGGGADDDRRGLPVYATPRPTIDVSQLNAARASANDTDQAGLNIPGGGAATLREAVVLTQPWESNDDHSYGGVCGLACRYDYAKTDGTAGRFTLYVEYLHLVTDAYLPKDGSGRIITADAWRATGKGIGFGPQMRNRATLSAADLTPGTILVGHLGATQFPHVHIQAAYGDGDQGYLRNPRFDPTFAIT